MKRFAIVAAVLTARPAHAGHICGSSSDGGSSSSGSSSSSSDSSSNDTSYSSSESSTSSTTHEEPACIDDSDVVGFRKCKKYGAWAQIMRIPRLFFELGSNVRQFESGLAARTAAFAHGSEQFAFRTVMSPSQAAIDTAVMTSLRIGTGIGRRGYAGTDLELGGLVSPAAANAEMMTAGTYGMPDVQQQRGLAVGALAIAGYRAQVGGSTLSIEGAGGVRSVRYHYASAYHDCAETVSIAETRGVVEARVRAETWLGPWVTAGATVGTSVIARGDWMAGAYLGFHTRAFGGGR